MNVFVAIFLMLASASAATSAALAAESELTGTYELGGATLVDPPPGEDPRSQYRVFLTGSAAKDLYEALKATEENDECLGDGSKSKRSGGISCTHLAEDDSYECSFAVGTDGRSVHPASAC